MSCNKLRVKVRHCAYKRSVDTTSAGTEDDVLQGTVPGIVYSLQHLENVYPTPTGKPLFDG